MNAEKRDLIYNRLLALKLKIDVSGIPNPRYLNEKLGECRVFMDEIERYNIETYQALSAIQQALNTATADYETKQEGLLCTEDIKSLPSDKTREAKVNNLLKAEIATIKGYQNELQALNYLLKAINLKNKNLASDNADIKSHIKIMEAQIRLGTGSIADPAIRSLLEEFKKSNFNKDSFEGVTSTVTQEDVVDPTAPLDINNLLRQGEGADLPQISPSEEDPDSEEEISESMIDPDPVLDPENNGENPDQVEPVEVKEEIVEVKEEIQEVSVITEEEPQEDILSDPLEGFDLDGHEDLQTNDVEPVIDLDSVIDFTQTPGGTSQKVEEKVEVKIVSDSVVQKQETEEPVLTPEPAISTKKTASSSGLDLDSLLDGLNLS